MVTCFYNFGEWFLYYTILNQNASKISQSDWSDFVFFNSKVSNLKSLSKICSTNNSSLAIGGLVSFKKCKWYVLFGGVSHNKLAHLHGKGEWHGPLSHWCREGKTLVIRPLKKNFFYVCLPLLVCKKYLTSTLTADKLLCENIRGAVPKKYLHSAKAYSPLSPGS